MLNKLAKPTVTIGILKIESSKIREIKEFNHR